ncbi:MAG: RNA polymerase sigma-70 factor [Tannerella sp.]|jgi:RNA polymerase sigma-70 factor (ECF subfamily)|nr:RNA polymerase sigma-70 factor [Tannerella sp.]
MNDNIIKEEQELFEKVRMGDNAAYHEIYVRYYTSLCEFASQYINYSDVKDIVQDLMMYLWEERENIIIESSLKSYLFSSLKNRCLNVIKKKQIREKAYSELYERLKREVAETPDVSIEELYKATRKAIEELPETYRETFQLHRLYDMSYRQLAERFNVSQKTIEYRMSSSLKILREKLKDYVGCLTFLL